MSQSANQAVVTGPGRGVINDGFGVEWALNEAGAVVADGKVDHDDQPVEQIAFVDGMIWRQARGDLRWSCKQHPGDKWSIPTEVSPLTGPPSTESAVVDDMNAGNKEVLHAIRHLMAALERLDGVVHKRFDALSTEVGTLRTDQTSVTALLDQIVDGQALAEGAALSNQTVTTTTLNAIVAAQAANQSAVVAALSQIVDAVTSPGGAMIVGLLEQVLAGSVSPLPAIAALSSEVDALTVNVAAIQTSVQEVLALLMLSS